MDRQDQGEMSSKLYLVGVHTAWYCDARLEWIGKIKKRNVKQVVPGGRTQHGTVMLG